VQVGEWIEYTVNVAVAGNYTIELQVANAGTGGTMHIEFGGVNKTGAITVPKTGGWTTYQLVTSANVSLSAGHQLMRVSFDGVSDSGGVANLDYININSPSTVIDVFSSGNKAGELVKAGPNPMRNRVIFTLPENAGAMARVEIYDRGGRVVARPEGRGTIQWDLTGRPVNPGVYYYAVTVDGRNETGRIIVLPKE